MDGEAREAPFVTATPIRVAILTMDGHLLGPVRAAERQLRKTLPGLSVTLHAASEWEEPGDEQTRVFETIAEAHIIVAGMLFLESQVMPILPALRARAEECDAIVGALSAPEVVKLTRLGNFKMDKPESRAMSLLKKLKPKRTEGKSGGESEAKMLRRLPQILKFIPGTAQDLRAYFLTMQYWLGGSDTNIANMIAALVNRYADGERKALKGAIPPGDPVLYPETGLYHPRMRPNVGEDLSALPRRRGAPRVGLLIMRSYVLAGDTAHYDGVIAAFEDKGIDVVPAFASGLDARPAIDSFFRRDGRPTVDAVVSLTGFSLIGGPAYNDSSTASKILQELDVPYVAAHALEFQSLTAWAASAQGLSPVEATMMVAMPELDGAAAPTVFGGRVTPGDAACTGCSRRCGFETARDSRSMQPCHERAEALAGRVERMIRLRKTEKAKKKVAVVIFNFPPNAGATGTAASLSVFESLYNLLKSMKAEGYDVTLPASPQALREAVTEGNAARFGADANVVHRMPVDDHVRGEKRLEEIEKQWGPAPGRQQTDGASIHIFGERFGNILVGVQPGFGYEGDPMRLLFEGGFTPTHAFAAFYRYLREDFGADAVVHFGTHGALEFMPGKQTALSSTCWPSYLIGDLPNIYLYAGNNPSEAAIAKRRSAAVTVSYLTPSVTKAGLYRSLADLKSTIERRRATALEDRHQRQSLALLAQAQAASLDLAPAEPLWDGEVEGELTRLMARLSEYEEALIPEGLHVAGSPADKAERLKALISMAGECAPDPLPDDALAALADGASAEDVLHRFGLKDEARVEELARVSRCLSEETEIGGILRALDGRFIAPAPGGDLISNSAVVPAGRNIHGFDPFRMPTAFAVKDGKEQAARLLDRHLADSGKLPETVAFVLWGTDNLKSEGAQVAQALALMGAVPRFDSFGRLTGASLVPLEELGRPRIDVVSTLSGIFRDLLPMQTKLLAEAALMAAEAEEDEEMNFVRKHALAYQGAHRCDLATAALRVFSNADGAYGANVNQLIDAGCWTDEDDLADAYSSRKCFAYGVDGKPEKRSELLGSILADVDLAYQNLESIELGVTTIDHYFDTLGGIGRAVRKAKGTDAPVYIGDQTRSEGKVRTLSEQVSLESRTRTLNPKWYEGMLSHGYEGVRQIEAQVANTLGWSATTGDVAPWVYQEIANTFVLDENLRNRLAALNPKSCARVADRLLEASERRYWKPDAATLDALREIGEDLEDRVEGIVPATAAMA